jgi:hypothetical protein
MAGDATKRDDATQIRATSDRSRFGLLDGWAGGEPERRDTCAHSGGVMASVRTIYRDGQGGGGAAPAAQQFVWVSLRDPSPDELAAV